MLSSLFFFLTCCSLPKAQEHLGKIMDCKDLKVLDRLAQLSSPLISEVRRVMLCCRCPSLRLLRLFSCPRQLALRVDASPFLYNL